jgi:hypothetical protein
VIYNAIAAFTLLWVAASGGSAFPWTAGPLESVLFALFAGLGAFASFLLLSRLPMTLGLAKGR